MTLRHCTGWSRWSWKIIWHIWPSAGDAGIDSSIPATLHRTSNLENGWIARLSYTHPWSYCASSLHNILEKIKKYRTPTFHNPITSVFDWKYVIILKWNGLQMSFLCRLYVCRRCILQQVGFKIRLCTKWFNCRSFTLTSGIICCIVCSCYL